MSAGNEHAAIAGSVDPTRTGPLHGVKVVEFRGLGPGPFAGMLLADMGADVVVIEQPGSILKSSVRTMFRGRRSVSLDLKRPAAQDVATKLISSADVLIEGFRPGVMERFGLGPDDCLGMNDRLIYARMTGWGQTGPLAPRAGHDINYLAVSGVLDRIGRAGQAPVPPVNYLGDLGGGGMLLAVGILAALVERASSNRGQVLDVSILDAASLFLGSTIAQQHQGVLRERGNNLLDSGAPFYDCYRTLDDEYLAVGCLEDAFYANFLHVLGLSAKDVPDRAVTENWPALRKLFAARIRTRTRDSWVEAAEGIDCCISPVLTAGELSEHPHNNARGVYVQTTAGVAPQAAPRFSRTPLSNPAVPPEAGADTEAVLSELGYDAQAVIEMREDGAFGART